MDLSPKNLVTALGALTALWTAAKLSSFLWLYIRPSSFHRYAKTKDGSPPWAFVTGASSGIGRSFALELASKGFNVVIHARNKSKLEAVEAELHAKFPSCEVRCLIVDASAPSEWNFEHIAASVSDVSIKVLVNNVGATMPIGHEFDTLDNYTADELHASISTNAVFPMLLTAALMPNLLNNQPALILNVGSWCDNGFPFCPAYAPSKAFVRGSCVQLGLEMAFKKRDIEVLGLRLVQVTDTGTIFVPTNIMVPTPDVWVKTALARVGCGRPDVMPYFLHALQEAPLDLMPAWIRKKALLALGGTLLGADPLGRLAAQAAGNEAAKKKV
ncbi:hypothetical protein NW767_010178 [Fusarium falciforme]|nr:hypothetical protein NW767_010178 [Fusarium falciforme]